MATPVNPLDKYATYACHFELHAAKTHAELYAQNGKASEASTTRFKSNGTLMINTRKDAHQTIDNVKIECYSPATSKTDVMDGLGIVTLDVFEPGSFAFIEKLNAQMDDLKTTVLSNMVFGLKVVFVGRKPDNSIEILVEPIMTLVLLDMQGSFDERGGHFNLTFVASASAASSRGMVGTKLAFNYINRSVSYTASTAEEALRTLENKINETYGLEYEKYLDPGDTRKLTCKITWDSNVAGEVIGLQANTFAPGEDRKFIFNHSRPINAFIIDIVKRTPNLLKKIGGAAGSVKAEFNQGAFFPMVVPSVEYTDKTIIITFHLKIYTGGKGPVGPFVFDYYFANSGQNVDVLAYDVKFNSITALLSSNTTRGQDKHTGMSGTVVDPKLTKNILHPNVPQDGVSEQVERTRVPGSSGDIAFMPVTTRRDDIGHNSYPAQYVPTVKLASSSMRDFNSSINLAPIVELRGHKTLLDLSIAAPGDTSGLLAGDGYWMKINIFMQDGGIGQFASKRQFFYTGYYRILSITHVFMQNKFTQTVTLVTVDQ